MSTQVEERSGDSRGSVRQDHKIYRGMTVVLPEHVHRFVHDERQPPAARAHMLLAEMKKQTAKNTSEDAEGSTGGLGNYWSPIKDKAHEFGIQGGFGAYREHELSHNCGDEEDGHGGCHTTNVIIHAHTPAEKHHWNETFRDGEKYDPDISWRLPIRPGAPVRVKGISWREGNNHLSTDEKYSEEGMRYTHHAPYQEHEFSADVKKRAGMNGDLPGGMTFRHETHLDGRLHHMIAEHPDAPHQEMWGNHVGRITWWGNDGEVANLHVEPQYQRRGVATELWNRAKQVQPDLKHSDEQTEEGQAWAHTTASYTPPGTMGVDNEGHRVQMTTMDGWAHDDGSHGHEDNTNIGDHPVHTEDGDIWTPSGRYWGPNSEQNDQRLFDGDHLRPEVREDILDRLNRFFDDNGYVDWRTWSKVYFAGSEAAKFAPFNGDFDVIIGINWPDFRENNPHHEDKTDLQVATTMTDGLWKQANVDGYYFHLDDGKKVGPFDRTFFCNPLAWDIRKLHPYAAYDVSDDRWAVKPIVVPKDWSAASLPQSYWQYADALVREIDAIGQLPPQERARMAQNLWEEIHTHRSDAFSDGGKGMFDLSNIIEKYLDQHPDKPWDKLREWRNAPATGPEPFVPTTASSIRRVKEADGADYNGVMVALVPPQEVCEGLAVDGGEPIDNMHITLVYLGGKDDHDEENLAMLPDYVQAWARTQKPLTARVGGVGTFVNPAEHVLWAAVDIPHGTVFRDSLVTFLEGRGYTIRHDHGWTPHLTMAYGNTHFRFLPKIEPAEWEVTEVWCCVGGNWKPFSLGDSA
jgi:GNAT superfamily N-acetyltransferase